MVWGLYRPPGATLDVPGLSSPSHLGKEVQLGTLWRTEAHSGLGHKQRTENDRIELTYDMTMTGGLTCQIPSVSCTPDMTTVTKHCSVYLSV